MDVDRDLFIQAFWTKCREVIRPELDRAVGRLRDAGHTPEISSLEEDATAAPEDDPSLTLATQSGAALTFSGDVARQAVLVDAAAEEKVHGLPPVELDYELDQLDPAEVASIVAAWEASLGAAATPAA